MDKLKLNEMEENTALVQVIADSGVEQSTATMLKEKFLPFFEQAETWRAKAETLIVTSETQVREMKMAREARLALKEVRVNADKTRIALKEDSLRYGKAVQGVYNVIEYLIVPIEKYLKQQEDFPEIQRAKRIEAVRIARNEAVLQYAEFMPPGIDLGEMTDLDYEKLTDYLKAQYQAKIEAEQREARERELDRIEQNRRIEVAPFAQFAHAAADLRSMTDAGYADYLNELKKAKSDYDTQQEQIRLANIRLQKEKEAAEAQAAAERAELERKIREKESAERAAKLAAEKAESDRIAAEKAAQKAAESAPDKDKLTQLAYLIQQVPMPVCSTDAAVKAVEQVQVLLGKVTDFIQTKIQEV